MTLYMIKIARYIMCFNMSMKFLFTGRFVGNKDKNVKYVAKYETPSLISEMTYQLKYCVKLMN